MCMERMTGYRQPSACLQLPTCRMRRPSSRLISSPVALMPPVRREEQQPTLSTRFVR